MNQKLIDKLREQIKYLLGKERDDYIDGMIDGIVVAIKEIED